VLGDLWLRKQLRARWKVTACYHRVYD